MNIPILHSHIKQVSLINSQNTAFDFFSAMSTSSTSATTRIPIGEQKGIHNFKDLLNVTNRYNIGSTAKSYLKNQDQYLICITNLFLNQHEMMNGKFQVSWSNLANATRGTMCEHLREVVPWLKHFEQDWGSDWIYNHLINQQVYDRN